MEELSHRVDTLKVSIEQMSVSLKDHARAFVAIICQHLHTSKRQSTHCRCHISPHPEIFALSGDIIGQ